MLLGVVLLWALNVTVTKYMFEHGWHPLAYGTIRYFFAISLFWAFTYYRERSFRIERKDFWLVGPATPHFAFQLRARVQELVLELPEDHPVRRYAEEKMELLERLGHASSKAHDGGREPRSRPGWAGLPSTAPADEPLPNRV